MKKVAIGLVVGALSGTMAWSTAVAQEDELEYVEIEEGQVDREGLTEGIDGSLGVEASFNVVSNQNVVGQNDGTTLLLGGGVTGNLDYLRGKHLWRNTLLYNTSWTRSPVLEAFVKNNDLVEVESLYNYNFVEWMSAFGRVNLETSAFATEAISGEANDYLITRQDGTQLRNITDNLRLAEPLEPLSLFQSVGLSLEPMREERIRTTFRVGFGARETMAEGVLVLQDNAATPEVDVAELGDAYQAGAEGFVGVEGKIAARRIQYRLGATALIPFINNDDQSRGPFELVRLGLTGTARMAIFEWMGLTYSVKILRDPQLLDEAQVQNSLLLTLNYSLIGKSFGV